MTRHIIALAALCATIGCTPPATRIADGLQQTGLDRQRSQCVGTQLQNDLSIGQLAELGRAAKAFGTNDPDPSQLSANDLIRVAGELKDPAILVAAGKAAAVCDVVRLPAS